MLDDDELSDALPLHGPCGSRLEPSPGELFTWWCPMCRQAVAHA